MNTASRLAAFSAASLALCAPHAPAQVPESLNPRADATLAMVVPARGVQVYECRVKDGAAHWAFVAPDAQLFDSRGNPVGHHGAGPYWQATDGSRIVASLEAKADAPRPGTIPWLLLASRSEGPDGRFSAVTQVQRVDTTGGAVPAEPCTPAQAGTRARVPYTATYRFFTPKPADAVAEWNVRAGQLLAEAKLGTPPAVRAMALIQTAVLEAAMAAPSASTDAAIAAANRAMLVKLAPTRQASIEAAYAQAMARIADTPDRRAGEAIGEAAAQRVLAARADDRVAAADEYRPHAVAGAYVPTASPAAPHWSRRKPWLMDEAARFRPAAPPALASAAWARDFNEVKALGARNSATRTEDQSRVARFWEYSLPPIYYGVVRSVAAMPGRDAVRNARLYAAVAQAMDDALISVFDAKYHYNFWRPVTAIRNGDGDGNDATERDAAWAALIDAPMHPEFPSGHAILAGAVGKVIEAELGSLSRPMLTTTSPTLEGAARSWATPEDFVREVAESRIYAGIHYRFAVEAGAESGRRIGELAAARHLQPVRVGDAR